MCRRALQLTDLRTFIRSSPLSSSSSLPRSFLHIRGECAAGSCSLLSRPSLSLRCCAPALLLADAFYLNVCIYIHEQVASLPFGFVFFLFVLHGSRSGSKRHDYAPRMAGSLRDLSS